LVGGINEFITYIDTNTNKTLYFTILIQEFEHDKKKKMALNTCQQKMMPLIQNHTSLQHQTP